MKITVKDIVVVGSGVGGLISSTILSQNGYHTQLIEKNHNCGGRMNSECLYDHDFHKYRFDVGPSLLLLSDTYAKTYQIMNENIDNYVKFLNVDPMYTCYFEEDKSFVNISHDVHSMKAILNSIEYKGYDNYKQYLSIASDFLRFGLPVIIEEKFHEINWRDFVSFLIACFKSFPLLSHETMLKMFFVTSKMRAMMSFQDLYIGLSPKKAPAIFSLLQALEFEKEGGFQVISESLYEIAKKSGVSIITNCTLRNLNYKSSVKESNFKKLIIESVDVTKKCMSLDGTYEYINESISANTFITNVDAPEFEQQFVMSAKFNDTIYDKRTGSGTPSCGVVSMHFALNTTLLCLSHHSIFISKEYTSSWNTIENPNTAFFNSSAFNFYIHAPSRTDSSVCMKGHDAITVLVPVPPLPLLNPSQSISAPFVNKKSDSKSYSIINDDDEMANYQNDLMIQVKEAVIEKINEMESTKLQQHQQKNSESINNVASFQLKKHIVAEKIRTPHYWKNEFSLFRGSAFGLTHSLDQLSIFRPKIRHPKISNLYRVGASTRPGNGVPLTMIGARLTAETVLKDLFEKNK